jgi:hypothetical protein
MSEERIWTVTVVFTEDGDATRADAVLQQGSMDLRGWGRARRNPADPDVPAVGEEIAAARALHDLGHHLVEQAAHMIETWEGRPVQVRED